MQVAGAERALDAKKREDVAVPLRLGGAKERHESKAGDHQR
jgi:hypothetical protein